MRGSQNKMIAGGVLFMLFLVSYRFSLLHDTVMLSYLQAPHVTPFQWILTYTFMMIGVPPTILLMLYESVFCHTALVAGAIQTICFGNPLSLAGQDGFFAYIVASVLSLVILWYLGGRIQKQSR